MAHAERLSTEALTIQFVGRKQEMDAALAHVRADDDGRHGRTLVVRGDSGTGKTFFVRELLRQAHAEEPDALYLYVDVANDEFQSAKTIASLLKTALVAGSMTQTSTISVPEELSLQRYRRQTKQRGAGRGFLRAIAHAIGTAMGFGSAVGAALDKSATTNAAIQVEDELAGYLAWVAKRRRVVLAVDNVQFLNLDVRLTIESVLQRVGKHVRFIAVERTSDGRSAIDPPIRCFTDTLLEVRLERLSKAETRLLVDRAVGGDADTVARLAEDIFTKTDGLAKDVEYCLRQYSLELGHGAQAGAIRGLLSTVDRLPLIHRQFLLIAAFLDGGVKKAVARGTVSRLAVAYDNADLDQVLDELITRDYLKLNTDTGDRLRPGHERIVTAIRDLADEDLHEDVRRSLIEELAATLDSPEAEENEAYLLHCLVGLQTARELTRNLHYISRLIESQHRQDQFSYLVAISDELHDILPLLPEYVLTDLLDAMQKASAFDKGLQVVQLLDQKNVPGADERRIYRLKYLTQAYRYDEALELSEELGADEWGGVYRINALLALDRVGEAREIADANLGPVITECQAVLRRNTITLVDPETALRNLNEAYAFFEREQSDFRLATVDTNRSVVHLHLGARADALRCLDRALMRMRYVSSREVYQPQLNLSILAALGGDYDVALQTLEDAALHVPRALLFDQVKINMNRTVIECVSGRRDPLEGEAELAKCLRRIRGIQMPYLQRALQANMAAARGAAATAAPPRSEHVSLSVPVGDSDAGWSLMSSVHWRY